MKREQMPVYAKFAHTNMVATDWWKLIRFYVVFSGLASIATYLILLPPILP
jgi:hypothetical protein